MDCFALLAMTGLDIWIQLSDNESMRVRIPVARRRRGATLDLVSRHDTKILQYNDQWRVVFRWTDAGPEDVEIIDYH